MLSGDGGEHESKDSSAQTEGQDEWLHPTAGGNSLCAIDGGSDHNIGLHNIGLHGVALPGMGGVKLPSVSPSLAPSGRQPATGSELTPTVRVRWSR